MTRNRKGENTPLLYKDESGKNPHDASQSSSVCQRTKEFFKAITLEPALFFHALSYSFEGVFVQNLWVDKICQNQFNYTNVTCQNLDSGGYTIEQDNVQRWATSYGMYSNALETIPSLIAVIFLGAWSDSRGRRLPVILPLYGYILKIISYIVNVIWWDLPPWCLLLVSVPYGFCGSMIGFMLGIFSYLSQSTSKKTRTTRFGILTVVYELSMPIGKYLGVIVFQKYGYIGVFSVALIMSCLSILYCHIRLEDFSIQNPNAENDKDKSILSLLSPSRVKKLISVGFKKRENDERTQIITLISTMLLIMFSFGGDTYLYTRKKFGWNYTDYTYWSMFSTPVGMIASMVVLPFQSIYLGFPDYLIGFIGCSTEMFTHVIEGTAPKGWYMYIGTLVRIFGSSVSTAIRGALTKLVPLTEVGAIFALLAIGETCMPIISGPLSTLLYNYTLDIYPGTIYLVSAGLSGVCCCIFVWLLTRFTWTTSKSSLKPEKTTEFV